MKNLEKLSNQRLSKEELKSINAGTPTCEPYPLCNGQEATFHTINSCGWYIYKISGKNFCMEYGAS